MEKKKKIEKMCEKICSDTPVVMGKTIQIVKVVAAVALAWLALVIILAIASYSDKNVNYDFFMGVMSPLSFVFPNDKNGMFVFGSATMFVMVIIAGIIGRIFCKKSENSIEVNESVVSVFRVVLPLASTVITTGILYVGYGMPEGVWFYVCAILILVLICMLFLFTDVAKTVVINKLLGIVLLISMSFVAGVVSYTIYKGFFKFVIGFAILSVIIKALENSNADFFDGFIIGHFFFK